MNEQDLKDRKYLIDNGWREINIPSRWTDPIYPRSILKTFEAVKEQRLRDEEKLKKSTK